MRKSLKRRFMVYLGLPVALASTLLLVCCILFAHEEIKEIYDTQLAQTAEVAASMLSHGIDEDDAIALRQHFKTKRYEYEGYVALRIWKKNKLLFATTSAESIPVKSFPQGFSSQRINDSHYRVYVLNSDDSGLRIEALQDDRARWDLVLKITMSILSPMVLFILSLPVLLWLGLKFGLKPLDRLSMQVARRSPNELAPIAERLIPEEIIPLVKALNSLLSKLQHTIAVERQFTNLAAHELRTPLAVIQTQLDAVMRDTDTDSQLQGLISLNQSVGRASQMIGQLLALARLGSDHIPVTRISLYHVVRDVAAALSPLALKKHITVAFEGDELVSIEGNFEVLEIAIRNLIDNAIKYTPANGSITITVSTSTESTCCTVTDSGAGIPAEHMPQVTERFYRLPGNREIGSGLGLGIVSRAAEIMRGALILRNRTDASGLIATLQFPVLN